MLLNSPAYTSSLNEVQLHHRDGSSTTVSA